MQKINSYFRSGLLISLPLILSAPINAAKFEFQQFVFQACDGATGDLETRCDDSNNASDDSDNVKRRGNLSGDSEDSLIPTQSLTNTTNALAQTRARIKALMEKARERANAQQTGILDEATGTRAITEAFQQTGYRLLLQAEYGDLDRDESELERGYETESYLFKIGADYRIADDFLVGALVGIDRYDQTFDADLPGVNFVPQANEGDSDVSNISLNVFATKNF
ncbi:MAG: autotransporter domain-containing protein, partial [Gammaproteobacteria bacterium]